MLDCIEHRGYRDLKRSQSVGLSVMGCVRLPIRDPIGGDQPAFNSDLSVAALLNGEIYNIDQFKGMMDAGVNSDTAMLPYVYRESAASRPDEDRFLQCRGMYAIIVHDTAAEPATVKILRDHIGIKPLFMAESAQGILFASEAKAFRGEVCDSIREVGPGELVTIQYENGRWLQTESKDVVAQLLAGSGAGTDFSAPALRNVISRAVASQWPGEDLPVAVLCSGGIDSSIVTLELAKRGTARQPVVAYTARCVDSASASASADLAAAEGLCQSLGLPLREVRITYDDLFNVLADVIYHVESFEPNIVRNSAIQYHVMRQIAADGFRVAFCGEGADELFWGYADFARAPDADELSRQLLTNLHRTQLQRVDRVGMAHTVEVRVPLLDESVVRFSQGLGAEAKLLTTCGIWLGKGILREAYAGQLPDEVVLRRKATLAYGAGFGGVEMNDEPMNSRAKQLLLARGVTAESVMRKYPAAFPKGRGTAERALYVEIYQSLGYRVPTIYDPPKVATLERIN
jgi:asparagine synthase (glutamine-hydrolysing)